MKKYLLLIIGLLIFTCSDDSSSTDPSGNNNNNNNNNNNETPEIEITGQWDISETRSIADFFNKRKNNYKKNIKVSTNSIDLGIYSIDSPITGELTATETITVSVGNYGTEEVSNFDLIYSVKYENDEWQTDITEEFSGSIASGSVEQYSFTTTADLSQLGQWSIAATTAIESDENNSNDMFLTYINSISYSSLCDIHSVIFEEDNTFSLYTNDEEGICNYVIFGTYDLDEEESTVTLYVVQDGASMLIGTIEDIQVENGEFSGTFNFENFCVQVVDGYEEEEYTQALTYIPDDNLEQWLVEKGYDNQMDDYMLTSNALQVPNIAIEADDVCYDEDGNIICTWEEYMSYENRFYNRLTNLAGIEAFPSVQIINLTGNDLDSINITQNTNLKYLYLNFNSFYKLDTSGNPNLQDLSLDNNGVIPEFDFSNNSSMKNIAMPNIAFGALSGEYIGAGGYFDISHMILLEGLSIHDNNFTSIDLSGNPNLTLLRATGNNFTSIDLSNNDNLIEIELGRSTFPIIVTSNMENLEILSVGDNPNLTSLDVSSNTELIKLEAPSCNLQGILDVSMLENLMELRVSYNPNLTCIKVNQTQLDNIGLPPPGFNWTFDSSITISLDCN